jgi:hypothetical protein
MSTTTSTGEKSFSDRVSQQLSDLRTSLDRAQENMQEGTARAAADLRAKRDEAHAAAEARHREVEEAAARMKARAEAKKVETEAAVAEWKAGRELKRLDDRAADAERHASAAIVVAKAGLEEAGIAILDAVAARLDAEEAKRGGVTKG